MGARSRWARRIDVSALSHSNERRDDRDSSDPSGDPSLIDTICGEGQKPGRRRRTAVVRGVSIGRYVVLDRIGAGGMGVVYAAYDPDLDRRVALKVMRGRSRKPGSASEGRARLLREAQAMAKVDHEHVIAVHDVGTVDGRVFIAMEFIDGQTVGEWVRSEEPKTDAILDVFAAAGRGLAAAHAQGLIHRDFKPDNVLRGHDGRVRVVDFGLARREDAKRSRPIDITDPGDEEGTLPLQDQGGLLSTGERIDPRPSRPSLHPVSGGGDTVELSDPGASYPDADGDDAPLLRSSSRGRGDALASDLTRTGALVGTPAYMAPEQHMGAPATVRSDQFSFCVSLYEALYGHRPFAGETHAELVLNLTDGRIRPTPPNAKVAPGLRRVLLRGLSVDPAQRFPSMDALLAALRRDPRRRRTIAAAAGAGALVLSAGLWVGQGDVAAASMCEHAGDPLNGVWDRAAKRRYADAFLATDKPYARDAWLGVSAALDDYTDRWVAARLDACEATHVRGEQSGALLDLRMECLDERLDGVRVVTALLQDADPGVVEGALDAVQGLAGPEVCDDRRWLQARRSGEWSETDRVVVAQARRALQQARARIEMHRTEPARASIEQAAAAAHRVGDPTLQAEVLLAKADIEEAEGQLAAARQTLREGLLEAEAGGVDALVAEAWVGLVWLDGYRDARFDAGREAAEHARARLTRMGGDPELAVLLVSHEADLAYAEGRYDDSLAEHRHGLQLRRSLDGATHPRTADAHTGIGHALVALERYAEALGHYDSALTILERAHGPRHPHLAHALTNVGVTQEYLGDLAAAAATHERALAVAEGAYGRNHVAVAEVLNNYASVLHLRGQLPRARAAFERALRIWRNTYGEAHPDVAMALYNLAIVAEDGGDRGTAIELHREALRLRERVVGAEHPDVVASRRELAALVGPSARSVE